MKNISKTYWDFTHDRMIRSVTGFCLDATNLPTTSSIVPFLGYINGLQSNMAIVQTLRNSISLPITGFAAENKSLKDSISIIGSTIMNAAYSYAIDVNNTVLANQMKISTSALEKMKYGVFVSYMQGAIDIITPIETPLLPYNVTASAVDAWQALVTQLMNQTTDPNNAIAFRKSVNEEIQNLLRACMLTLYNNCDRLAKQFAATNLPYYNNYKANRKLKPTHVSTQLRLHVNNVLGNPVAEGEAFIVGTSSSGTLTNGYCLIDHIPFGTHTVALTTPESEHVYGPFTFKKGKSLTLHVQISTIDAAADKVKVTEENVAEEVTK